MELSFSIDVRALHGAWTVKKNFRDKLWRNYTGEWVYIFRLSRPEQQNTYKSYNVMGFAVTFVNALRSTIRFLCGPSIGRNPTLVVPLIIGFPSLSGTLLNVRFYRVLFRQYGANATLSRRTTCNENGNYLRKY